MLLAGPADPNVSGSLIHAERTFFGVYRIRVDADGRYRRLFHGTTLHGMQASDPAHRDEPLTYYHRRGPFGQLIAANPRLAVTPEVAVVGLGVGALASYASSGQRWTFYEIDPAVERLSRAGCFTFLRDCADRCDVVIGDARLSLIAARPGAYGLIVLDAFSSDAIPMHLMTAEALSLYLSRLAPGGLLAFHISNRHVTLGPILGRLALVERLQAREQMQAVTASEADLGQAASDWVVMARSAEDLGGIASDPRWVAPTVSASTPLWTDDFSNILSVLTPH
jgi:spermidine synthase